MTSKEKLEIKKKRTVHQIRAIKQPVLDTTVDRAWGEGRRGAYLKEAKKVIAIERSTAYFKFEKNLDEKKVT